MTDAPSLKPCEQDAARLARIIFDKRGNHYQAYITEPELAAIICAGMQLAVSRVTEANATNPVTITESTKSAGA